MKVIFVRHGQSEANRIGIIQGSSIDTPLSSHGLDQAEAAAKTAPKDVDVCFCSHLMRARQTAKIMFPYLDPVIDDRLIERGLGVWEGKLYDESRRLLEYQSTPEGGEEFYEVEARIRSFLEMLKRDYPDKKVACVSHAGTIYSALEMSGAPGVELGNAEWVELEL